MKKIKLLFLIIACLISIQTYADVFTVNNVWYQTLSNNTVEVTYKSFLTPTETYVGDMIIPATVNYNSTTYQVTGIGGYALFGCNQLTSIVLQSPVINNIGTQAFKNCTQLNSITFQGVVENVRANAFLACPFSAIQFQDGLQTLEDGVFWQCPNLSSIQLPNTVTDIGPNLFNGCSALQSVVLSSQLTTIPDNTFFSCEQLQNIIIPENVNSIGQNAFYRCSSLGNIIIPDGVTQIGNNAFNGCNSLQSIVIPDRMTEIAAGLFQGCTNLKSVIIPSSVESIGDFAFTSCSSLLSVEIPEAVNQVGMYAFVGCTSLQSVTVAWENPAAIYFNLGEYCFIEGNPDCILYVPAGALSQYQSMDMWSSQFASIIESEKTGITTGMYGNTPEITGYYSILGQKLPQKPEKGFYIILYSNGKPEKQVR